MADEAKVTCKTCGAPVLDEVPGVVHATNCPNNPLRARAEAAEAQCARMVRENEGTGWEVALREQTRAQAAEAQRDALADERDAFRETYSAVNEVLLSGSTQRADPTAERVHANLTRLTKRADAADADALAARRERDALAVALREAAAHHDAMCAEHGFAENCGAMLKARAALAKVQP